MNTSAGGTSAEALRADGLARIARALAELSDQDRALNLVCEHVRRVLGTTAAVINLLDEANEQFHWSAHRGVPAEVYTGIPFPRELFEQFAARFDPIFCETRPEALRAEPSLARFVELGLQAIASATVHQGDRLFGLVSASCYHSTRQPFEPAELTWLQTVGDIVVQAVLRQRALVAARESEARYRRIVTTIRDGVLSVNARLQIDYANPQMARILGCEIEDLLGRPIFEFVADEWRGVAHGEWAERQQGVGTLHRFCFRRRDGSEVHTLVSAAPLRDSEGHFSGSLSVITDITEQRNLELKLQHAQKLESLGVLAGGIAHDFNNLLVGVLGNAALALDSLAADSPVVPALQDIQTAAQRAAELTRQMLAYSGRGRFRVELVDINHLIRETAHLLGTVISKRAVLSLELQEELPGVQVDVTQMGQVIMNLVTNASDALGEESGSITIRTGLQQANREYLSNTYLDEGLPEGEYVFVEVADTGCGMTPEIQQKIFDPFFSTKFTGRGLGLAAVLGILRGHRGAVKVTSEVNQGTRFRVLLPVAVGAQSAAPVSTSAAPGGQGLVLVVDDEEAVRSVARRVLERAGYQVMEAPNGKRAIEVFAQRPRDFVVVLLDMMMPGLSGAETLEELRRLSSAVPVVLSSGYDEQDAMQRFGRAGLSGFLHKPWLPADLLKSIARAAKQSAA